MLPPIDSPVIRSRVTHYSECTEEFLLSDCYVVVIERRGSLSHEYFLWLLELLDET